MKNLIYLFVFVLMIGCSSINQSLEKTAVKTVLNDFITAVQNKEFSTIEGLISEDFIIYENGLVWNFDEFSLKLEEYGSVKINYELSDLHLIVDKTTAHAQYINKGTFIYPDTTIMLNFIESATLIKENTNWKITFYHSTHLK